MKALRRWLPDLIIIGLVLAAGSMVFSRLWSARHAEWEARVDRVTAVANENLERAREAEEVADSLRSQAARIASNASERSDETDSIVVALPPPRTPAEEERDVVIGRLVQERDMWRTAYETEAAANRELQRAYDLAIERGDSLDAVLADRPGPRPWYIPKLVIGGAGVLDEGAIEIKVPAVTLGWEVRF